MKVRWGILGYAKIAREHVMPALLRASNCELAAVASRDEATLAECRKKYPQVQRFHRGYAELLADPKVDAVYIPLPNAMHREWTIRAAEAGKHVLCEKPIALNRRECHEMIEACAKHGVKLMEGFMYRFTDRTRQVRAVLESGALGEIKFVQSTHRFLLANPASIKLKAELGGGCLYDVGVYPIHFAGMVADFALGCEPGGASPRVMTALAHQVGGVDVIFSGVLRYANGLIASLNSGFNAQKRIHSEIVGTEGVLEVPDTFLDNAGSLVLTRGEERKEIPVAATERYRLEVEDFASAILEGRDPGVPLPETVRNMDVLDGLFAAL